MGYQPLVEPSSDAFPFKYRSPYKQREPEAISLPSASRKPPEVYEGEYGLELIYQLDEDWKRYSETFNAKVNAKVTMFNDAMLDIGISAISAIQAVKGLISVHPEPIEPYQPKPAYESFLLNAGYEAELIAVPFNGS